MASDDSAKLTLPNQEPMTLGIFKGTLGPNVLDIRSLSSAGIFTYDPGFRSTAACQSKITFIDGQNGQLLYRGYAIETLAEHSDFIEISYLLLYGELPTLSQRTQFVDNINTHTLVHEQITQFLQGYKRDAHPMAMLGGLVNTLAALYHEPFDIHDAKERDLAAIRLIAKLPTLTAMCYKYRLGQPFNHPQNHLNYTQNFLHMLFSVPSQSTPPNPVLVDAMDKILLLHADHEQNASTSAVRLTGSSGANPFACIAAGIATLWGPAHGGANEAVIEMLEEIGDEKNIPTFIEKAKDKNDPFRLMGFGHRVYKNFDPRAKVMRESCHQVLAELGHPHPLFNIALRLEEIALKDPYFIEKKLYPNIDFYSGIILKALGIPSKMFTTIFALARTVGWVAHWQEMVSAPDFSISRPRQLYCGQTKRDYIAPKDR